MQNQKEILSLHPWLDTHPLWQAHTVAVTEFDSEFYKRSFGLRFAIALRIARNFRKCVLYGNDVRFAAAIAFALRSTSAVHLYLVEAYPPIVSRRPSASPKYFAYRSLFGLVDRVYVHSSFEVQEFSDFFHLPEKRFRFVPYFPYYDEHLPPVPQWNLRWGQGYVLCPGRHRDLRTFIRAAALIQRQCIIVAGQDDLAPINSVPLPANLLVQSELSAKEYDNVFAHAALIVLPFFKERFLRSLGHIAYFESARHLIPVITSRSPHLADYASENDQVLCFASEQPMDLAQRVNYLFSDPERAKQLAQNARAHISRSFSRDKYVTAILGQLD